MMLPALVCRLDAMLSHLIGVSPCLAWQLLPSRALCPSNGDLHKLLESPNTHGPWMFPEEDHV